MILAHMSESAGWRIPSFGRGDRFRKAREDAGFPTANKFADHIGVDRTTVHNYESGKTQRLHKPTVNAWALATHTPVAWLVDGVDPTATQHTDAEVASARHPLAA